MQKIKEETFSDWKTFCFNRHDVYCNQKYGDDGIHPYSFHLRCVEAQAIKFLYLIKDEYIENTQNFRSTPVNIKAIVLAAVYGHDLEEDARMTYNNIRDSVNIYFGNYTAATLVADIILDVSDEKGKDRSSRKNDKFYRDLNLNKYAIFVKLCDIIANTLYSKLLNSKMYEVYKSEYQKVKEKIFLKEYEDMFNYLETL